MRNEWYPCKKAEYMTPARFHELGITRADIGERDRGFVPLADEVVLAKEQEPEPKPAEFSEPSIQPDVMHLPCTLLCVEVRRLIRNRSSASIIF